MTLRGIQLDGLNEALRKLAELPDKLNRKYIRAGVRSTATLARRRMRALVPRRRKRGGLRDAIALKNFTDKPAGEIGTFVFIKRPQGSHAHLIEFGHAIVTRGGRHTGRRARAFPFIRPGSESAKPEFRRVLTTKIREGIAREARKR